jgi:hypothetical protein
MARNQKFTAQLTGTDDLGYTDGGTEITYEPETTECTNSQCFVGYQWNVVTGFWTPGVGNITLQERIGSKWINIQTAKPVADPAGVMKKYVTFVMKVNYQATGKHTYRLSLAASKKYSGRVMSAFTQIVSAPYILINSPLPCWLIYRHSPTHSFRGICVNSGCEPGRIRKFRRP